MALRHLRVDIGELPISRAVPLARDAAALHELAIEEQEQAIIRWWNAVNK